MQGVTGAAGTSATMYQGSHSFGLFVKSFSSCFNFLLKMRHSDHLLAFMCMLAIANIRFYFCKH